MGLSTTYTKTETDFLIQQLEKKTASGYKGDLNKSDPAPTQTGFYGLLETGVYTNLGGIDAQSGKLNFASFDGTTWSLIAVEIPINYNTGKLSPTSTDKAETGKSISDYIPKEKNSINLFDNTQFVADKYFNYNDVNYFYYQIAADAVGWFISSEIPVTAGEKYIKKQCALGFFDSNDKMIAAYPVSTELPVTAPSGAVTARITAQNWQLNTAMLVQGESIIGYESGAPKLSLSILPDSIKSRKGNNLIISKLGGGDFRHINDAVDWLRNSGENHFLNPFTFEIIDGDYIESVNMIGLYLTLKGRNRENCIIRTYTNDYYNPPIDMAGNNHLENLTIWADDDGHTTPPNGVGGMPAYGIHFDISGRLENLGIKVQGRSVVKNCRVIAKHQHAVGQGLWTDEYSEWEDCEFYAPNTTAFRTHSYLPSGATNQQFLMRNCRVWNNGTHPPIVVQDANLAGGNDSTDTVYTFQENTFWNDNGASAGNALLWTHELVGGGTLSGRIKLGKGSFGNNIPKLNY